MALSPRSPPPGIAARRLLPPSGPPRAETYKQVIIDIYETLYHFRRGPSGGGAPHSLRECIDKWYDPCATFGNPFTKAIGVESIIRHFSLMSLVPGQIWSELGDICESDDCDGNRVIIFSHTLHFDLLADHPASDGDLAEFCSQSNPSRSSTPPPSPPIVLAGHSASAPAPGGSDTTTVLGSATSALRPMAWPGVLLPSRFRPSLEGGTKWPIRWLLSEMFSPIQSLKNTARFDLKLMTKLRFNEQVRIVDHEDIWGIKEAIEFLSPKVIYQSMRFLRRVNGFVANVVSGSLANRSPPRTISSSSPTRITRRSSSQAFARKDHKHDLGHESLFAGMAPLRLPPPLP